ncbi:hypothetical protein D9611_003574 [Ephemerocybe angulata]|uniref:Uncharacterized protein n=1 Tax=Ephemerocybe angulata TaxID=980116 RepID=A0A8H5EYJ9_9AGAR|nr:hypothetical protein D9611_003574 [Tulosesus angulatus]
MPAHRLPLRQRCKVQLTIRTTTPFQFEFTNCPVIDRSGYLHLKAIRAGAKRGATTAGLANPRSPAVSKRQRQELRLDALSQLYSGICVAYCNFTATSGLDDREAEFLNGRWTHVVRIVPARYQDEVGMMAVHVNEKHGVQTLTLPVPPCPSPKPSSWAGAGVRARRRPRTVLTDGQLTAARDFLSLALPNRTRVQGDEVQVLITAPRGERGPVDVMAVAACYLSFGFNVSVRNVLDWVREGQYSQRVHPDWKGAISENDSRGIETVERIAGWNGWRGWSG